MASSSMALLKRANKFIHPFRYVSVAPSLSRSFNRSAELISDSGDTTDEEELNVVEHSRSDFLDRHRRGYATYAPNLYSGEYVLDPFAFALAPPICLNQIMPGVIDNYGWNPFAVGGDPRGGERASAWRRGWNVSEDEDALYLKVDMPGLGKEHVKVSVEKSTLVIKGEGEKEDGEEENVRRYSNRIDLPEDMCRIGEIKAEMKNGVLRVSLPKVKEDERKDVVEVNVQ